MNQIITAAVILLILSLSVLQADDQSKYPVDSSYGTCRVKESRVISLHKGDTMFATISNLRCGSFHGSKEATYSDGWKRDDPVTIASFDSGEACCPILRRLPNGDLVVGVGRGGDFLFADNNGANIAWFRSRDNGVTWAPDQEFRPPYGSLFIRGNTVRCYDQYSFAIKGRTPTRYICRYAESTDGGRTFSKHGISTYDTLGHPEGDSPYLAGQLAGGLHGNIGPWREILDEAGWKGDDWINAPVGGVTSDGLDHHGWLEMPDGSLLTFHSSAKRADWRSANTLVSRSTDGGISWEFVARVNPERYDRVEGYNEASPMLHKDGRLTVIMRNGGGGFPLVQAESLDGGRTWSPPKDMHPHLPCVRPSQIRLRDGALALVSGRPGMFVCFDPVGDGRHWEFNGKHDLWDREMLTLKTQAKPTTERTDLRKYMDTIWGLTREDLAWARPELVDGYMSGWENLAIEELPNGDLLVVYDVQNWISESGAPPVKAIRVVRMRREAPKTSPTVDVKLGERQVLFAAPDTEGTRQWGVYGCPDMFRDEDGSIVVYDGGHMDTYDAEDSARAPAVAFRSRDNGLTWEPIARESQATELREGYGASNKWFSLADGARVQFAPKGPPADLNALGVTPRAMIVSANEYGLVGIYRAADIPLEGRTFQVRYQPAGSDAPEVADAVFDLPDVHFPATLKAKTGIGMWPDVRPTFAPLDASNTGLYHGATGQEALVEAPDGAWLSAVKDCVLTERNSSAFHELRCVASTDHGKTWRARGVIVGRAGTTFGATEEFSLIRLGDELVCVNRMDQATVYDPHRHTVLARSSDNGFTWSAPEQVASSSVTPHLVKLENGVVALVFGRPGVHVQFSTDGCRTWNALTSLIGKTAEEEVAAGRDLIDAMYGDTVSYSNTRTVITGPDRFLVLYTDFKYGGEKRKAIVVQEVIVTPTTLTVTRHPRALCAVPSQPPDQEWAYQLAHVIQLSPTEIGLIVNIRRCHVRTVDLEVGNDLLILDRIDPVSPKATVPMNRSEIKVHPRTGEAVLMSRYPLAGGFVPLGALRADGSPHPHAGTGFALSHVIGFPVDAAGNVTVYTEQEMADQFAAVEVQQYRYDGTRFVIEQVGMVSFDALLPGWEFTSMPMGVCLADGDDLLGALVGKPVGSDQAPGSGLARWRRVDGQWRLVSYVPVTPLDGAYEPSLVRDTDGSLLFCARGGQPGPQETSVLVWRSTDGGATWDMILHAPNVRAGTPVTINQATDGTVYIAGNPHRETDSLGHRLHRHVPR